MQRATGADKVASVAPLDARASGLMLLCFGSATRLAPRVERAAKRYTVRHTPFGGGGVHGERCDSGGLAALCHVQCSLKRNSPDGKRGACNVKAGASCWSQGTLVLGGSSLSGDVRGGSFRAAQLPAEHLTGVLKVITDIHSLVGWHSAESGLVSFACCFWNGLHPCTTPKAWVSASVHSCRYSGVDPVGTR